MPRDFDRAAQPFQVLVSVTLGDKDVILSREEVEGIDDCDEFQFAKYPDRFKLIIFTVYTQD
jgi:hypothetical protein